MESLSRIVLGILILQIYVHAAPGDVSKLEDIAKVEQAEPKVDAEVKLVEIETNSSENKTTEGESTETQRQKRWYNPYNFGFPPIPPPNFPTFDRRDQGPNPNFYGQEDPLAQIHRRIQEIANLVRQPPQPPFPHVPIFFPILYVPPEDCRCDQNPAPTTNSPPTSDNNVTTPNIFNRWPVMEDERQNWGFLINETDTDDGDNRRPISFDPIRLNRPTRPPPPVEHGSVQSDANNQQNSVSQSLPPTQNTPPTFNRPQSTSPSTFRPQSSNENRPQSGRAPPSACDGAVLTCCHQPQVTYDCFAIQGCPQFTSFGNPCEPKQILTVIEKFQNFYGQRGG